MKEMDGPPEPGAIVFFTVLCQPKSGIDLDTLVQRLSLSGLNDCLPDDKTVSRVRLQLEEQGFVVNDDSESMNPSPLVSAQGSVKLFETVFHVKLLKRVRRTVVHKPKRNQEWVCSSPGFTGTRGRGNRRSPLDSTFRTARI